MPTYNKTYKNGKVYGKVIYNGKSYGKVIFEEGSTPPQPVDPSLLLDIPFDGDFENKVIGGIQMVVAGGAPSFANGAAVFNGSQSIKTETSLDIGTDKITLIYWVKSTQTSLGMVGELSQNFNAANAFVSFINETAGDSVFIGQVGNGGYNYGAGGITVNNGVWHFVACTIDRERAIENSVTTDGVKQYIQLQSGNNTGNFDVYPFFIGQRGGNAFGLIGELKLMQLYNRVLSDAEILAKYNEVPLPPIPQQKYRFIRDTLNNNIYGDGNLWVEIQAFANGQNVALNKTVTGLNPNTQRVTNGNIVSQSYYLGQLNAPEYVTVDLGALYELDSLKVYHYYADSRKFYGTKTEVSEDGITWVTVFDSAVSGEYTETAQGHEIILP